MNQIEQKLLCHLFEYADGALYWKNPSKHNSYLVGKKAGTVNGPRGYRQVRIKGRIYMEHRVIYLMLKGVLPEVVDHVNGDPGDNRIENLRACTQQQNMLNSKGWGKSGIKGVTRASRRSTWQAQMVVDGKQRCLGNFKTLEEAASVVKQAREKHHGEFAKH
jgi:hypothetical protein